MCHFEQFTKNYSCHSTIQKIYNIAKSCIFIDFSALFRFDAIADDGLWSCFVYCSSITGMNFPFSLFYYLANWKLFPLWKEKTRKHEIFPRDFLSNSKFYSRFSVWRVEQSFSLFWFLGNDDRWLCEKRHCIVHWSIWKFLKLLNCA